MSVADELLPSSVGVHQQISLGYEVELGINLAKTYSVVAGCPRLGKVRTSGVQGVQWRRHRWLDHADVPALRTPRVDALRHRGG
jgi:hypothetical protein